MNPSFLFLKKNLFCVVLDTQMIKKAYFNFRKYTFKYMKAYVKVPYNIYYLNTSVHFCLPFIERGKDNFTAKTSFVRTYAVVFEVNE